MPDPGDPLLDEHAALMTQIHAWVEAWKRRREPGGGAAMVILMSAQHLGEPVATRLEKRLLLAKAHLEGRVANLGGAIAAAIATLGGDADVSGITRSVTEAIVRVGGLEEDFGSKLAELGPLVECYRRLRAGIG